MNYEQHKARHIALHRALDELLADWITNSGLERPYLGEHTILELVEWSHEQIENPTPDKYDNETANFSRN